MLEGEANGHMETLVKWSNETNESPDLVKPKTTANEDEEDLEVETEVQRLLNEEEKMRKKKLKKVRKEKRKLAERYVLKMAHESDHIEQNDDELFSLAAVNDLVGLEESNQLCGDTSHTGADDLAREQIDAALKAKRKSLADERRSAVEGRKRVHFERRAEDQTADYLPEDESVTGKPTDLQRDDLYVSSEDSSDSESDESDKEDEDISLGSDYESSGDRGKRNPLLVDLDDSEESVKKKRKIDSWFGSNEIKEILTPLNEDNEVISLASSKKSRKSNCALEVKTNKKDKKIDKKKKKKEDEEKEKKVKFVDSSVSAPSTIDPSTISPEKLEKSIHRIRRLNRPLTPEERALATRLIHSAKSRRELLESGYNRFQFFEKSSELPDWFVEDEKKHMRKPIVVKKEEIPVDIPTMGRSLSKAEQAKARKKARLAKRLKRIRQKAEDISDEIPETEKWQQIKQ
ncbi:unnamed protein product [Trichobilharzia regenti]|nr:unnamed protein product [Trichobilharzia regenti]